LLLAEQFAPLSRANFLAHLAARGPAEAALLLALLDAHVSVDVTEIYTTLKKLRNQAGCPTPSLVNVNEGLHELFRRHAEAAILGYDAPENSTGPLLECTRSILATGKAYRVKALIGLLDAYRLATTKLQSKVNQQLEDAGAALLQRPDAASTIEAFTETLLRWIDLYRPFILLEAHRGHRNPDVGIATDRVRRLLADLSIDQKYPTARKIADLARAAFSSTPAAIEQFSDATAFLQNLAIEAAIKPLRDLIDRLESDPQLLIAALEKGGFGKQSSQPARNLWKAFRQSIKATQSSGLDEQPWILLRDFALRLGNRPHAATAAARLLAGLVRHGERTSLGPAVLVSLRDALSHIEQTHHVTVRTESRGFERAGRWLALACAALLGAASSLGAYRYFENFSLASGPTPGPFADQTSPTLGPELMPPVGKEQHLNRDYVRYCRFQEERLRIIKGKVQGTDDIKAFNALANDYNSRCANFYYLDDDLKMVMDELAARRRILEADAQRIIATWPWRATSGNPSAPAVK
jgi:hypothetical protein